MKKKKKKISSKRLWERRRKIRGLKYMECAFLLSSLAICAHISYTKILLLLSKGREIKKKEEKEKEKLGEEERKKNAMGVVGPNHFCVSLCRFGDLEDGVDKVFASFLIYKSHGATPLQTT